MENESTSKTGVSCDIRVYRNLGQVLKVLSAPDVIKFPQVQEVLKHASFQSIVEKNTEGNFIVPTNFNQNDMSNSKRNAEKPFLVIEGLDGSDNTKNNKHSEDKQITFPCGIKEVFLSEGKITTGILQSIHYTLSVRGIEDRMVNRQGQGENGNKCCCTYDFLPGLIFNTLEMELCVTPPKEFSEVRSFFDNKPEGIRRAFYSLGNYIAAQYVRSTNRAIIMDRFWHGTAAYAFANHIKSGGEASSFTDEDLEWPSDLFKPNLVIFLDLSEQARMSRHTNRKDYTNTPEEQALASDAEFRKNITECLERITGVPFVKLNVDGSPKDCEKAITDCVLQRFPTAFTGQVLKLNVSNK